MFQTFVTWTIRCCLKAMWEQSLCLATQRPLHFRSIHYTKFHFSFRWVSESFIFPLLTGREVNEERDLEEKKWKIKFKNEFRGKWGSRGICFLPSVPVYPYSESLWEPLGKICISGKAVILGR